MEISELKTKYGSADPLELSKYLEQIGINNVIEINRDSFLIALSDPSFLETTLRNLQPRTLLKHLIEKNPELSFAEIIEKANSINPGLQENGVYDWNKEIEEIKKLSKNFIYMKKSCFEGTFYFTKSEKEIKIKFISKVRENKSLVLEKEWKFSLQDNNLDVSSTFIDEKKLTINNSNQFFEERHSLSNLEDKMYSGHFIEILKYLGNEEKELHLKHGSRVLNILPADIELDTIPHYSITPRLRFSSLEKVFEQLKKWDLPYVKQTYTKGKAKISPDDWNTPFTDIPTYYLSFNGDRLIRINRNNNVGGEPFYHIGDLRYESIGKEPEFNFLVLELSKKHIRLESTYDTNRELVIPTESTACIELDRIPKELNRIVAGGIVFDIPDHLLEKIKGFKESEDSGKISFGKEKRKFVVFKFEFLEKDLETPQLVNVKLETEQDQEINYRVEII